MNDPISFKPNGDPYTALLRTWGFIITLMILFSLVSLASNKVHSIGGLLVANSLFLMLALLNKQDVEITIYPANGTLEYQYMQGWGAISCKTIDLLTAEGTYRPVRRKQNVRWELELSNNHAYGKTKVRITQGSHFGFSKLQLDEISVWVDRCKQA